MKKKIVSILLCMLLLFSVILTGCGKKANDSSPDGESDEGAKKTKISMLWIGDGSLDGFNAVCELAEKELGIIVDVEKIGGGEDGDNVVKTRLHSGDMADLLCYNGGSLLSALNPGEYFEDLSKESFMENVNEDFKTSVRVGDSIFGIPSASTQVGAVLYNKEVYEKYNLEVPHTWDDFLKNCETLKEAGETAVLGTFGDSWTAQVPYLGDNYNVLAKNPNFPEEFEAGKAKYATDPAGLNSFEKMEDLVPYYNDDYLATSYDDGCEMLMEGNAAHWIILSSALENIYSLYGEDANKLGCFGIPDDDADNHGITVWEPNGIYANKNGENIETAKKFMEFYISAEALDAFTEKQLPNGPYAVTNYELPENCHDAVKQMQTDYFDTGKTALALEFLTPIKGPNSASICQELGSGQTNAAEAAGKYDEDCKKQAVQLGLDWD